MVAIFNTAIMFEVSLVERLPASHFLIIEEKKKTFGIYQLQTMSHHL